MSMQDLKNTTIGGRNITLRRVPARDARHLQTMLIALVAEPLAETLGQQVSTTGKPATNGEQILAGLKGLAGVLPKLSDGELDKLIDKCKPFILIEGKQFNENDHFDADTLFDMYEVLYYFLKETFDGFITAVRSRFPQAQVAMTALKK